MAGMAGSSRADAGVEAAAEENRKIQHKYSKDKKVGEGTYAVVYLGELRRSLRFAVLTRVLRARDPDGEEDRDQEGELVLLEQLRRQRLTRRGAYRSRSGSSRTVSTCRPSGRSNSFAS